MTNMESPLSALLREYAARSSGYIYQGEVDTLNAAADELDTLRAALRAICTTDDSGPWVEVYRAAGGGYEGLQAIAEAALNEVQQ